MGKIRRISAMKEKMSRNDLISGEIKALSDNDLDMAVGGLKAGSGKWIVTPDFGCDYYMAREGLGDRYAGAKQCRYCKYKGSEAVVLNVCNHPNNT
jgi:hypothetical protein